MVYDHAVKFGGVWYAAETDVPEAPADEPKAPPEPQKVPRGRGKSVKKIEPESIELEV